MSFQCDFSHLFDRSIRATSMLSTDRLYSIPFDRSERCGSPLFDQSSHFYSDSTFPYMSFQVGLTGPVDSLHSRATYPIEPLLYDKSDRFASYDISCPVRPCASLLDWSVRDLSFRVTSTTLIESRQVVVTDWDPVFSLRVFSTCPSDTFGSTLLTSLFLSHRFDKSIHVYVISTNRIDSNHVASTSRVVSFLFFPS